jgi:transcriptional regulator with XRE-family HTH domain
MTDKEIVAEKIRTARKQAGLTQQQLATRYDIPMRTLESWERALRKPPEYVLTLLLRCIELDFNHEDEPAPKQLIFLDNIGRPLKEPVLSGVKRAYDDGKVQDLGNSTVDYDGNYRPDPKGRLYMVLEPDKYGLDLGLTFYVKEV